MEKILFEIALLLCCVLPSHGYGSYESDDDRAYRRSFLNKCIQDKDCKPTEVLALFCSPEEQSLIIC
jgi:hypothetical protein